MSVVVSPELKRFDMPPTSAAAFERAQSVSAELDAGWLRNCGIEPDEGILSQLNELLGRDVEHLTHKPVDYSQALLARRNFFDLIGMPYIQADNVDDKTSNGRTAFENQIHTLMPLSTVVATFRVYNQYSINIPKLVNSFASAISYAPESVAEKMENFTALGIDGAKLVNSFTSTISYAPESVAEKMENFKALGIYGAKLVNSFASAISYAPESIKLKKLLCQKLGVWETVLKNLNSGKYIDWLILPIESSIIAVAERTEAGGTPTSLKSIRRTSDIHAKGRAERLDYVRGRIADIKTAKQHREFANKLGAPVLLVYFKSQKASSE